ncbi:type IV pilus modification protein PilV [Peristeroidobacter agariperforans]|uniref:type IV pilus modification protein PilV n=1 Tax=Peristeroidobacter agariperforans TaxID=268404 RepID=UPI00101CBC96|nr:type IV pilus modification protein PilV [Peristeroidobacter agariperforans]
MRSGPRAQAGVGLIEVLVSLLVLSIGMLGLAGLQMYSLRNNQGAMERSMAVVETHSIVDAMRADRAAALAGDFDFDSAKAQDLTGETFAERALETWHTNLLNTLGPGANGVVACTSTGANSGVCTITVRWSDERSVGSTTERKTARQQEVTTEVQL